MVCHIRMIWDMAIDRGATTLSVWTRSRGAYVWPLPSAPAPVPVDAVSRKTHGATPYDVHLLGQARTPNVAMAKAPPMITRPLSPSLLPLQSPAMGL